MTALNKQGNELKSFKSCLESENLSWTMGLRLVYGWMLFRWLVACNPKMFSKSQLKKEDE